MANLLGHNADHSVQSPKPTPIAQSHASRWSRKKYFLRWVIFIGALLATITSLVWIKAPRNSDSWILLSPLYGLPYPILSLIWEAVEIIVIAIRHSKSKGVPPAAHVGCELVLCMAGVSMGAVWLSVTTSYMQDSYFTTGKSGVPGDNITTWASVTYFWCAVVLFMAAAQFTIFVLSCIEVDSKRRQLESQVSHILKVIEERGGNPEEVLRNLQEVPKEGSKPIYAPVELSAINHLHPAELSVEERLMEMGEENRAGEMPANTPKEAKAKYRF